MKFKNILAAVAVVALLLIGTPFSGAKVMAADSGTPAASANYLIIPGEQSNHRIFIENTDSTAHRYTLAVQNLPEGFSSVFMLDGKPADTVDISSAGKLVVEFRMDTPSSPSNDDFSVLIQLVRDDGQQYELPLSFTVNHDYQMEISNQVDKLQTISGKTITLTVSAKNTGNKDLQDLTLQVDAPYKWVVTGISPEKVNLAPGESGIYTVQVLVPSSQSAGSSNILVTAQNKDAVSQQITIPVTVTSDLNFVWIVLGLVVVAGVGTLFYFRRKGRR